MSTPILAAYLSAIPTAAYMVYLTGAGEPGRVARELAAELATFDPLKKIAVIDASSDAARLLDAAPSIQAEVLIVGAETYTEADWRLLDRRRSALAREGITVLVTTPASFGALMRVAPNLASWLGGLVFEHEDPRASVKEQRERRLAALREWSGKTDDQVIAEAEQGPSLAIRNMPPGSCCSAGEACSMADLAAPERYTTERAMTLPSRASELCSQIRWALIRASNAKKIKTPLKVVDKYVALLDEPPPQVLKGLVKAQLERGAFCIVGGEKNQNRDRALSHFERKDGAWFDFTITVREEGRPSDSSPMTSRSGTCPARGLHSSDLT